MAAPRADKGSSRSPTPGAPSPSPGGGGSSGGLLSLPQAVLLAVVLASAFAAGAFLTRGPLASADDPLSGDLARAVRAAVKSAVAEQLAGVGASGSSGGGGSGSALPRFGRLGGSGQAAGGSGSSSGGEGDDTGSGGGGGGGEAGDGQAGRGHGGIGPVPALADEEAPGGLWLPRKVHIKVRDKGNISCQVQANLKAWSDLNPGWEVKVWDDADADAFVKAHYPGLFATLYSRLLLSVERADLWRALALHRLGGVYADNDVRPLTPVAEWATGGPASPPPSVLVGSETRDEHDGPIAVLCQWVFAAAPGHPFLGRFVPAAMTAAAAGQLFDAAKGQKKVDSFAYEGGVLARTGPGVYTEALRTYLAGEPPGVLAPNFTLPTMAAAKTPGGLRLAGGVRLLSSDYFGRGFELWQDRYQNKPPKNTTCSDIKRRHGGRPLVCHLFRGSWKGGWWPKNPERYTDCRSEDDWGL